MRTGQPRRTSDTGTASEASQRKAAAPPLTETRNVRSLAHTVEPYLELFGIQLELFTHRRSNVSWYGPAILPAQNDEFFEIRGCGLRVERRNI